MPAVSVEDRSALETLEAPASARWRPVRTITSAPRALEGEGFPVRRAFFGVPLGDLDPFVHMDQMGEVDYGPGEPRGTPWHPHRGFETVTYMIDGVFEHQDSIGGGGVITNGATQWMTAGRGILHIERPPEDLVARGGLFHGVQLWVNLPARLKMVPPRYQDIAPEGVTLLASKDGGALVRVIAGEVGGHRGPGRTHTPIAMVHLTVAPGATLRLPWPEQFNALVYVLAGHGEVGTEDRPVATGNLVVHGPGDALVVRGARQETSPGLEALVLGGQPLGEPVAALGPFVMNTRAELAQAFEDYRAGRLGQVPAERL